MARLGLKLTASTEWHWLLQDGTGTRRELTLSFLEEMALVVLAAEVGGRWSEEARKFLGALATAKARSAPVLLQPSVRAAWLHRWRGLLACTAARSFAESLLGNTAPGVDGAVPSMQEVLCDFRHLL